MNAPATSFVRSVNTMLSLRDMSFLHMFVGEIWALSLKVVELKAVKLGKVIVDKGEDIVLRAQGFEVFWREGHR